MSQGAELVTIGLLGPIGLLGLGLGGLNAVGLWWSVRAVPRVRHPGALLAASFLLRLVLTFGPMLALAGRQPDRLIVGLAAVLIGRRIAVHVLGVTGAGLAEERNS